MTKLLSLIVHLASAIGDPHTFAIASTYIFIVIVAKSVRMASPVDCKRVSSPWAASLAPHVRIFKKLTTWLPQGDQYLVFLLELFFEINPGILCSGIDQLLAINSAYHRGQ